MKGIAALVTILTGAALVGWPAAAVAEVEIGVVIQQDFTGATGTRVSGQTESLVYFERVFAEERVDTDEAANTSLQFLDETSLYVGSLSSVMLDRFVYDPSSGNGDAVISFGKGAFRFITGSIKNKEAVSLRTPTASMVIRGTHLLIFVLLDGTSEINVLDGAIDILPCEATEPQRIDAGDSITITPDCDSARAPARLDNRQAGLIPQMPPDLAAVQDVIPAAGGEDVEEEEPRRYEESGKGDDRDNDRQGQPD
jgi:hypothetical protein